MEDFITTFLDWTSAVPSPEQFRLWSGISGCAGALERRVQLTTSAGPLYSNLFVLLVAPPGVGKSMGLSKMRELYTQVPKLSLAPNSVTKAGLLDALVAAGKALPLHDGDILQYHALSIMSSEFGVFCPAHDLEFLSVLNDLFDPLSNFREERRDKSRCVDITNPYLNIIAGTQPGFLASMLPEEAWSMGFMSRNLMVYAPTGPKIDLFTFHEKPEKDERKLLLVDRLKKMSELQLQASFTDDYKEAVRRWQEQNLEPIPTHSKLQHYLARRLQIFLKLSLVSAISRTMTARLDLPDFERAKEWLIQTEEDMADIFRDMALKSDAQVIADLHMYLWKFWVKEKKASHESRVYNFLKSQTIAGRIPQIIDVAVRSRVMQLSEAGGQRFFTPRPTSEHGME